ncbi:O-acetylhomoserine aminocarboxypropyltransferase [Bartonella sp. HY329]|uniref:O-acetylhomoserine aminocarboxypropyltransferase n=1 Tax=unclassified Bartonella TaxID=2645622 RepID=UPI0021C9E2CF|nr:MULTISPECIES: O-acetylhomoserine aminocarboxypropyltransferase [unclassified Bartonella]UXM96110.1 O-acetylhomoserine aminocarboxypropyltransferase [Bartonella sp. HY329]UXN10434.1 O-acetylhomoserine aminocarboxypropyltransferase [Bartonella sp. HY328]
MSDNAKHFDTLAIHAGAAPDPTTGARVTPIYQTTAYVFEDADQAANRFALAEAGNIYTRITNPTQAVLEERMAALEGGVAALATATGHAAEFLTFHTLMEAGDNFIAARQLYGGSINQFGQAFKSFDWQVRWADGTDPASFAAQIDGRTKAIFIESFANPGGIIIDIAEIAKVAEAHNIPLIVDNTMASPYLLRPIEHGANIVIHSLTKFIGGHGNSMGGVIIDGGNFDWHKSGKFNKLTEPRPDYAGLVIADAFGKAAFALAARVLGMRDFGPTISPFNAFMLLTGVETLSLRMQRHCDNALAVAEYLQNHPQVSWVSYAGLKNSPYYALQQRIAPLGAGSVFTFGIKGGYEAGVKFVAGLKLFSHLANIGDTRSLVIHPASTTHRQLNDEQKHAAGAGPDVIRLSIGIEGIDDILGDLTQSFAQI